MKFSFIFLFFEFMNKRFCVFVLICALLLEAAFIILRYRGSRAAAVVVVVILSDF